MWMQPQVRMQDAAPGVDAAPGEDAAPGVDVAPGVDAAPGVKASRRAFEEHLKGSPVDLVCQAGPDMAASFKNATRRIRCARPMAP